MSLPTRQQYAERTKNAVFRACVYIYTSISISFVCRVCVWYITERRMTANLVLYTERDIKVDVLYYDATDRKGRQCGGTQIGLAIHSPPAPTTAI